MYQQGQIVEYINAGKSQRGMIIANNKCLQYSNVFQVVPFRFGFFPALEKRDIINTFVRNWKVFCNFLNVTGPSIG